MQSMFCADKLTPIGGSKIGSATSDINKIPQNMTVSWGFRTMSGLMICIELHATIKTCFFQ